MKKREPRLFSMILTLRQLAHNPGSTMRRSQCNDADLAFRVAGSV